MNHNHRSRQFAVYGEAGEQVRSDRNLSRSIHTNGLVDTRDEEKQRDAGIGKDVAQAVNPVVGRGGPG